MNHNATLPKDLLLSSYHYELPSELIADRPCEDRHSSRLLVYYREEDRLEHRYFYHLPELLPPQSMLVLNQSKVFPARVVGQLPTGGVCEVLILSLTPHSDGLYPSMVRSNRKKKVGDQLFLANRQLVAQIGAVYDNGTFGLSFPEMSSERLGSFLQQNGEIPIPHYIRGGKSDEKDREQYQTVYASNDKLGSVAAPTAGLHFTPHLFAELEGKGIQHSYVTLHVGMGTFTPVKSENIGDHQMHTEWFQVDESEAQKIVSNQDNLIAVGTTSLRVLESCIDVDSGRLHFPSSNEWMPTSIFLYPGKKVQSIKGMITNFHLPGSTLLMLVSSLLGREKTLELYQEAIKERYRFFSFGDAMLIL